MTPASEDRPRGELNDSRNHTEGDDRKGASNLLERVRDQCPDISEFYPGPSHLLSCRTSLRTLKYRSETEGCSSLSMPGGSQVRSKPPKRTAIHYSFKQGAFTICLTNSLLSVRLSSVNLKTGKTFPNSSPPRVFHKISIPLHMAKTRG